MDPSTSLGLSLLANSNTPGNFGSIFGRSALQAGQDYQSAQFNQLKIQQLQQQMQQQAFMQQLMRQAAGGQPQTLGDTPAPQGQQQPQGAPQDFLPGVSQMPPQQAPSFGFTQPPQQSAPQAAPQAPSWLTPPSPQDIAGSSAYGSNPALMRVSALMKGDYGPATEEGIHKLQLQAIQQQLAPKINSLDMLIKSDTPSKYMKADQQLTAAWPQLAQQAGIDPKDYTDDNVRYALTRARNQVAASIGLPAEAPAAQWRDVTAPNGLPAQENPITHERKQDRASEIDQYNFARRQGYAGSFTDFKRLNQTAPENSFNSDQSDLLASLAERGISLPAGMRSKQQQVATLQGLLDRNPGKTSDQIADLIGKGQISFGSEKKATSTAAGIAGRTATAENEILDMGPMLLDASSKVPRGSFVPINKLLQMKDEALSDPNLKTLKIYVNSMLNAYDQLAARGGTDKNKRAEAHSLLTSAESPEALAAGIKAFQNEASIAKHASEKAAGMAPTATGDSGAHPQDIQDLLNKYPPKAPPNGH